MALNVGNIRIIGYSLALLYAVSLLAFLGFYETPAYRTYVLVAAFLYITLTIGSIAAAHLLLSR